MREIRLDTLLTTRPSLRPGEVVTVVASVARDLAAIHAAGGVHGAVSTATVVLEPGGRPRLVRPLVPMADASPDDDVRALGRLGDELVGPFPPQRLVWLLHEAAESAEGAVTATAVATKALAACQPEPVRCGSAGGGGPDGDASRLPQNQNQPPVLRPWSRTSTGSLGTHAPEPAAPWSGHPVGDRMWLGGDLTGDTSPGSGVVRLLRRGVRRRGVLALLVPLLLVGVIAAWTVARPSPAAPVAGPTVEATTPAPSADVWRQRLETLDRQRAMAYARGDQDALRAVYVPGSEALADDLATLRAYRDAGLHVRGLRLRVAAVRELSVTGVRATLAVTDRLDSYQLVDAAGRVVRKEQGRAEMTWHVTLHRGDGTWRIAAIRQPT